MKRLVKRAVMPIWRLTAPLRRPLMRRLDSRLNRMISASIEANLMPTIQHSLASTTHAIERLERSLDSSSHSAQAMAGDVDLMLGSVVREIARIQIRLDALQDVLCRTPATLRTSLTLVEGDDENDVPLRPASVERSRVG